MTKRWVHTVARLVVLIVVGSIAAASEIVVVRPGDTLSSIARAYGVNVDDLVRLNGLTSDLIVPGQRLVVRETNRWAVHTAAADASWDDVAMRVGRSVDRLRAANPSLVTPGGRDIRVPPSVGTLVAPAVGDDLVTFASRVGASPGTIVDLNDLSPPYRLEPGVPLVVDAVDAVTAPASALANAMSGNVDHERLRNEAFAALASTIRDVRLRPPDVETFGWPLPRPVRLTSPFGWRNVSVGGNRYHLGIDLAASTGTPVAAARTGTVTRAGWIGSYGYAVYVDHGGGTETRYAHLSVVTVRVGERVITGATIGRVGSTGASTGPHLHFEVRRMGSAIDPMTVLPAATATGP